MKKSVSNILYEIESLQTRLDKIRSRCPHKDTKKEYGSNTGNYDPTSDIY